METHPPDFQLYQTLRGETQLAFRPDVHARFAIARARVADRRDRSKARFRSRDLTRIYCYAAAYFGLALFTLVNFHFRQRFALELGEAVVHDMRTELFAKLMTMPMSFFNQTKFGRIISRMTSDIDSVRAGVQDVLFVIVVQGLQMTVSAALMAWYDWKLFSLMVLLAPVIWFVNKHYQQEMTRRHAQGPGIVEPRHLDARRIRERHPRDAGVRAPRSQRGIFSETD